MSTPSDLASAIRTMATGTCVDWSALDDAPADASVAAVLDQLKIIAKIADVHGTTGTLVSEPQPDHEEQGIQSWGSLTLLERIGEGSYGVVYRAWDSRLDRDVALKLLRPHRTSSDGDSPTIKEGRLLARVRHPNVVSVYGADRIDGRTGIWMEFVSGRTLEEIVRTNGPLSPDEAVRIGIEVARGLSAVHRAGIVHRDVKAQNVMVQDDGRVVLMDFGSGHGFDDAQRSAAGTPLYVAPEVLAGGLATARSDIYSLGVLFYYMVTGAYPRAGTTVAELRQEASRSAVSMGRSHPELPKTFTAVVDRALAPETVRFQSVEEVERALVGGKSKRARNAWLAVAAAIAAIATASAVAVRTRNTRALRFAEAPRTQWVIVGVFENNTGDPQLDGLVEPAFRREFGNGTGALLLPEKRIAETLTLMRRPSTTRLQPAVAREIALRDGDVDAVITGRLDRVGGRIIVSAEAVTPSEGNLLLSLAEPGVSASQLDPTVRREVARIRKVLADRASSIKPPEPRLRRVTSPSLLAVQHYSQAAALLPDSAGGANWDDAGAEGHLEMALREDPDFASAHILLAHAISNQIAECQTCGGQARDAHAHAERAMQLAATVTSVERNFILGSGHSFRARTAATPVERESEMLQAIAGWEAVVREQPDFPWALNNIVGADWVRGHPEELAPLVASLADDRPDSFRVNAQAALAARDVEDDAQTDRYAARAEQLMTPDRERAYPGPAAELKELMLEGAWLHDDPREMLQRLNTLTDRVDRTAPAQLQTVTMYGFFAALTLGRLHDAEVRVAQLPEGSWHDIQFVRLLKQRRDFSALHAFLERHVGGPTAPNIGVAWAENGFFDEARRVARLTAGGILPGWSVSAERGGPTGERGGPPLYALEVEESIAVYEHRPEDAVRLAGMIFPQIGFGDQHVHMTMMTAEALVELGRFTDAMAMLETSTAHRRAAAGIGGYRWMNARAQLASLYRRVGREAEARAVEDHLLKLLAVAEPDHPLLLELKARVAARNY